MLWVPTAGMHISTMLQSMRVRTGAPARAGCMSLVADPRLGDAVIYRHPCCTVISRSTPQLAGKNSHHIVEATFKAFARALRHACETDPRRAGTIASSKGVLTQQ